MSQMKERFVCALVGAYAEAIIYKEKDPGQYPPLASLEDLGKRREELQEERLVSFERFCTQLLEKPKSNPRFFSPGVSTPLINPIIPATLLFVRHPDKLSRFIKRFYYDKEETSQDFALAYATILVLILEGKSPAYAIDFTSRYLAGGRVLSSLEPSLAWVSKVYSKPFRESEIDGSGFTGALVGAHMETFVLPWLPIGWRRMEKLAWHLYEASQHVVVGQYT